MSKLEIVEEDYYTGTKLKLTEKRPNYWARIFMKMGFGKTADQANLWVIFFSVLFFGISFFVFLA